jgi:hypothetical protein
LTVGCALVLWPQPFWPCWPPVLALFTLIKYISQCLNLKDRENKLMQSEQTISNLTQ